MDDFHFTPTWFVDPGVDGVPNPRLNNGTLTGKWSERDGLRIRLEMGSVTTYGGGGRWAFQAPIRLAPAATCTLIRPSEGTYAGMVFGAEQGARYARGWPLSSLPETPGHSWLFPFAWVRDGMTWSLSPVGPCMPWTWCTGDELVITAVPGASFPIDQWLFSLPDTAVRPFPSEG